MALTFTPEPLLVRLFLLQQVIKSSEVHLAICDHRLLNDRSACIEPAHHGVGLEAGLVHRGFRGSERGGRRSVFFVVGGAEALVCRARDRADCLLFATVHQACGAARHRLGGLLR